MTKYIFSLGPTFACERRLRFATSGGRRRVGRAAVVALAGDGTRARS
jgi:hypothetical protein